MAKKRKVIIRGMMQLAGENGEGPGDGDDNGVEDPGEGDNGNGDDNGGDEGEHPHPDPGPGAKVRCLPVVKAIALPEGEELPTHSPTMPGHLVIVRAGKRMNALGWLEKESDIPHTRDEGEEKLKNGHWVPVEPLREVEAREMDEPEFAFVFEVDEDFGVMQGATPLPQPQPAGAPKP